MMWFERPLLAVLRHEYAAAMRFVEDDVAEVMPAAPAAPCQLYVHVPFCEVLCPFCSFHRVRYSAPRAQPYFDALRREIDLYHDAGFRFGDVYVGGAFQQIGGQVRCCIAKLGGDDASLNPAWGAGADAAVTSLGLSPDGFVYVSGPFTQINGQNRDRFARLDGSTGAVDMAFSASLTASQAVASYAFVDDALYISGSFTTVGGVPRNYVARPDAATGAVDAGWAPSANRAVDHVLPAGESVFLAGDFSSIVGTLRFQLAKVSTLDATLDPDWDPQVYDGSLIAALLDPAGNLLIGGSFRNIGLSPRQGLAAIAPAIPVVVLPPHIFGSGFEN